MKGLKKYDLQEFFHDIIIHNVAISNILNYFPYMLKAGIFISLDRIRIISVDRKANFFDKNSFLPQSR